VLLACLLVAPSALAAPGKLRPRGFGPVSVGMTRAQAGAALGASLRCSAGGTVPCACATLGRARVTFGFADGGGPGLDFVLTGDRRRTTWRGLRVGDSMKRARRLHPELRRRAPRQPGTARFAAVYDRFGLQVQARQGKVITLMTGLRRFFGADEFCA
jgi:hypothetical protein